MLDIFYLHMFRPYCCAMPCMNNLHNEKRNMFSVALCASRRRLPSDVWRAEKLLAGEGCGTMRSAAGGVGW